MELLLLTIILIFFKKSFVVCFENYISEAIFKKLSDYLLRFNNVIVLFIWMALRYFTECDFKCYKRI
jgi:hypothetical protein